MNRTDNTAIMVIGDDPDFNYLMRRYAAKAAHRAVFVHLGEDALALAARIRPVAIILEGDLTDGGGRRVLSALKDAEATRGIPIVFCSWLGEGERSAGDGVDVYLQKPILYEDFLGALVDVGVGPSP